MFFHILLKDFPCSVSDAQDYLAEIHDLIAKKCEQIDKTRRYTPVSNALSVVRLVPYIEHYTLIIRSIEQIVTTSGDMVRILLASPN